MHCPIPFRWLVAFLIALACGAPAPTRAASERGHQRDQFRMALEALRLGKPWKPLAADLGDYPLLVWLEQGELRRRLDKVARKDIDAFLARWPDALAAADLRGAFLRELARRQQWADYLAEFDPAVDGARDLACHALHARIAQGDAPDWDKDFASLWNSGNALPDACDAAIAWARQRGLVTGERTWARIELARKAANAALIDQLAATLPGGDKLEAQRSAAALRDPAATLKLAVNWPDTPHHRDAVLAGLPRLARRDADAAATLWPALKQHFAFTAPEQGRVDAAIALSRATDFEADAVAQLAAVPAEAQDDASREWRVRAALGAADWNAALAGLDALSEKQKEDGEWRYLRARVLGKLDRSAEAQPLLETLANEAGYHGFLAADWLGRPYALCPLSLAGDAKAEAALLAASPELARAFEWQALDRLPEARRSWDFAVKSLDDAQRRLAVDLAGRRGWHDRAVFSLTKGDELKLYEQRFPLPRESQVKRESAGAGIDPTWAFAIIRAESAFMPDARSAANAYGLMQLLPSTAQALAKAEKIPYHRAEDLYQPTTNIALGTRYLARMAQRYDGAPWLASAAYNAGTQPVEKWLAARGSLDPDFFIATIPYRETREYVARVLAYGVIYDWRLHRNAVAIGARMPRPGQPYSLPDAKTPRKAVVCPAPPAPAVEAAPVAVQKP